MWAPNSPELSRSMGWQSPAEAQAIIDGSAAFAGIGGAGYLTAEILFRDGVGIISSADPDEISRESLNRIVGADKETIGVPKVVVQSERLQKIDSDREVIQYPEGVTVENAEDFLARGHANVVLDGIDLEHPEITVALARAARRHGIPMVSGMEIGPSAMVTSFHPHKGPTFEKMAGFRDDEPLDEIADKAKAGLDLSRLIPYLPYKSGDFAILKAVLNGASLPSNGEGSALYASMANHEMKLHLTSGVSNNREQPVWANRYYVVDHGRRWAGTVRGGSPAKFYGYVALGRAREAFGMNPRADSSYGK